MDIDELHLVEAYSSLYYEYHSELCLDCQNRCYIAAHANVDVATPIYNELKQCNVLGFNVAGATRSATAGRRATLRPAACRIRVRSARRLLHLVDYVTRPTRRSIIDQSPLVFIQMLPFSMQLHTLLFVTDSLSFIASCRLTLV